MNTEFLQNSAQMLVVDGNQVVQAFSPNGPDESFTECVRLGGPNRRSEGSHAEIP